MLKRIEIALGGKVKSCDTLGIKVIQDCTIDRMDGTKNESMFRLGKEFLASILYEIGTHDDRTELLRCKNVKDSFIEEYNRKRKHTES
jgi:hypothetical protein